MKRKISIAEIEARFGDINVSAQEREKPAPVAAPTPLSAAAFAPSRSAPVEETASMDAARRPAASDRAETLLAAALQGKNSEQRVDTQEAKQTPHSEAETHLRTDAPEKLPAARIATPASRASYAAPDETKRTASGETQTHGERREYSGKLLLRIPRELHRQLAEEARQNGVSLNQYALYKLSK